MTVIRSKVNVCFTLSFNQYPFQLNCWAEVTETDTQLQDNQNIDFIDTSRVSVWCNALGIWSPWKVYNDLCNEMLKLEVYLGFSSSNQAREKERDSWLSHMIEALTPTENSKKQSDNTKTPPKTSITRRLRTNLGRSVGVTIATQLVHSG